MTDARATVRLPRGLYADAQELAAAEHNGSLSALFRAAVEAYVAAHTRGSEANQAVADGGTPMTGDWSGAEAAELACEAREHTVDRDLAEAIAAIERVEWGAVPDVSASTAATFTRMLCEARDSLRECQPP